MKRQLSYILILTFCFQQAVAQILPFKTYTVKDGLISNQVTAVIRDNRGLLWIGSPFGVNWFDGNRFTEPAIPAKGGQLYVTGFFKDHKQTIWVLSFFNGIYKFENGSFRNFLPDSVSWESNCNTVFDMIRYDDKQYLLATDNNIFWFDGKSFSLFDKNNPELRLQFSTIGSIHDRWLFFGNSRGLTIYQKKNSRWHNEGMALAGAEINKIMIENNSAWITTNKGLLYFDKPENILAEKPAAINFPGQTINHTTRNPQSGELWITADKLYRINSQTVNSYDMQDGLPDIPAYIYFDQENIAWLCSGAGLTKLVGESSIFYDLRKGPTHSMITSLAEDENNELWLGTFDGLGRKVNDQFIAYRSLSGKKLGYIAWLLKTKDNRLLAGSESGIVLIRNSQLYLQHPVRATEAFEDQEGIIWLGTETGDVYTLAKGVLSQAMLDKPIKDYIDAIYRDNKGQTWIGYRSNGIRIYRGDGKSLTVVKEYSQHTGFTDLRIRSVGVDDSGNLLFGTRTNGLFLISAKNNDHTKHINIHHGLSSNWIKSITKDSLGRIYLATNKGVNTIQGSFEKPVVEKLNFWHEELTGTTNCIYPSTKKIWIGTETGILENHWSADSTKNTAPPVFITELTINGKKDSSLSFYSSAAKRSFRAGNNIISVSFTGIDLKNEMPLRYRYKLEGQDQDWTYAGERNFVSYNLPAGHYIFKAEAQDVNGNWSREPAVFNFTISAPFWKTWWFIATVMILFAVLSFFIYRYRLQQALKLERLRSRISTDLHDDIGSTLSSISILSEIAAREIDHRQSAEMMQEIKQSSVSLMEKMDDIVWSINPRNDSIGELMLRIKRFSSRLFEAREIDYTIHIDDSIHTAKLDMECRQHIYLIMKEAINNLVKYAGCTRAVIDVKYRQNILDIEIRDDGRGFNEQNIRLGNGILSMRKRAEAIRATIRIESAAEKGTLVSLQTKIK